MPWQQHVVDVAREIDPETGRFAYNTVVLVVPRQSGKSTLILASAVHRALAKVAFPGRQQMIYTAQDRNKSREKFEEGYWPALEDSPLRGRAAWKARNGSEHIRFSDGSRWGIDAATDKSGHGATLDEAFVDEAFAQRDGRLEQALRPTMITRPNTMFWLVSTMGWLGESAYFESKVAQGRSRCLAGATSGVAYFEWSAPEDADPADPEVWWSCMPALGHTISEDAIRGEFEAATDKNQFRRAYLNQAVPRTSENPPLIDADGWDALMDPTSTPGDGLAVAFDVSPDQSRGAVAVASARADGVVHVEITDAREGDSWIPERVVELVERWSPRQVVCEPSSTAAGQIARLEDLGVDVTLVGGRKYAASCAGFYSAVLDGQVSHRGQPVLDAAVGAGQKRATASGWKWVPRAKGADITPLVAVTLARQAVYSADGVSEDLEPWFDFS